MSLAEDQEVRTPRRCPRTRSTSCWWRKSRSTGCAGSIEPHRRAGGGRAAAFDPDRAWRVHPQVALRDESFGALAYHYGTRRLLFLKSRRAGGAGLGARSLRECRGGAWRLWCPSPSAAPYSRALARLAESEVIDAR